MTDDNDQASNMSPAQRRLLAAGQDSVRDLQGAYDALADPARIDPALWSEVLGMLGDDDDARTWMRTPQMALNYRRPVDMIDDPIDRQALMDHITRVTYGTYT